MENNILDVCDELVLGNNAEVKIPFLGRGNIWIKNSYKPDVIVLARHIIYEAVQKTYPGQLSVIGLDSDYSGLFAPFSSLASGATRTLELLSSIKDFETKMDDLGRQIQAVQNVIQGRYGNLIAFRAQEKKAVEGYRLVVLYVNLSTADEKFLAKLSTLMLRGPDAGVSFLIITTNNKINGGRAPHSLDKNVSILGVKGNMVALLDAEDKPKSSSNYPSVDPSELVGFCDKYLKRLEKAKFPTVEFKKINNIDDNRWKCTSEEGLSFVVGEYGVNDAEITIGDETYQRHNALITGAVGQGKSNLISVIIHSLCQRYSPEELNLYLLDFKEGVSLKPFVNIGGQQEYLPHAKVVGLESDIALGYAVLEFLYEEYQRRLKEFKERDVKSFKEFRTNFPDKKMPRIVAIIDEFQLMFGDDMAFGQKVVDLLEKSVRLFRAAGIHFILATQSISGNLTLSAKKDAIFSQVPIRIAHKNSITESQNTLGLSNSAAAELRPHEAIVNRDYGEISQNNKTVIAYADDEDLRPLRYKWWKEWEEITKSDCEPPYVFDGEKEILSSQAVRDVKQKQTSTSPRALLGEKISVTGDKLSVPLSKESGHNIAIIGSSDKGAEGMIQGIALSLAAQHKVETEEAKFFFCDFRGQEESFATRFPDFAKAMQDCGFSIEDIPRDSFKDDLDIMIDRPKATFDDVFSSNFLEAETPADATIPPPKTELPPHTYVFALGLERWKPNMSSEPALKVFLDSCAEKGIHFIGWWVKPNSYKAQVSGYEGSDAFNTQVFLRIEEDHVRSLSRNPSVKWKYADNRALFIDESEEIVFIPYAPI